MCTHCHFRYLHYLTDCMSSLRIFLHTVGSAFIMISIVGYGMSPLNGHILYRSVIHGIMGFWDRHLFKIDLIWLLKNQPITNNLVSTFKSPYLNRFFIFPHLLWRFGIYPNLTVHVFAVFPLFNDILPVFIIIESNNYLRALGLLLNLPILCSLSILTFLCPGTFKTSWKTSLCPHCSL